MTQLRVAAALAAALLMGPLAAVPAHAVQPAPTWLKKLPSEPKVIYLRASNPIPADSDTAQREALRAGVLEVVTLVGYEDEPGQAEARKAFQRSVLQSLAGNGNKGLRIESTYDEEYPEGKIRTYLLIRASQSYLGEARAQVDRLRPKSLTVSEAARQVAEAVSAYVASDLVMGRVSVRGFHLQGDNKRHAIASILESEITKALARRNESLLKVQTDEGAPLVLTGEYHLADDKRSLIVTATLLRQASVLWASPEIRVTQGDFSDLVPPHLQTVATPAPVTKPVVARPANAKLSVQQKVGRPRLMVILPEFHVTRPIPDPAGETEIVRQLVEAGFKVVDQSQSKKIRQNEQLYAQLKADPQRVAALGREFGAEIVVFGEAFSETVGATGGGTKVMARVEARAVRCDTAEILVAHGLEAEATEASEMVSSKKALRQAGNLVARYFVEQLAARWSNEAAGSRSIEVLVHDISYPQLVKLKEMLRSEEIVQAFHQRLYEENMARFEMDCTGDPQDLVDALVTQKYGDFEIELVKLTGSKVELRLHR